MAGTVAEYDKGGSIIPTENVESEGESMAHSIGRGVALGVTSWLLLTMATSPAMSAHVGAERLGLGADRPVIHHTWLPAPLRAIAGEEGLAPAPTPAIRDDSTAGCGSVDSLPSTERTYRTADDLGVDLLSYVPLLNGMATGPDDAVSVQQAREAGWHALEPTDDQGFAASVRFGNSGELLTFLSRDTLTEADTWRDLYEREGAYLLESPAMPRTILGFAREQFGDEAASVRLGPLEGVLLHGDEFAPGLRPFTLFWSDGTTDWVMTTGLRDPIDVVELARSMVCTSETPLGRVSG